MNTNRHMRLLGLVIAVVGALSPGARAFDAPAFGTGVAQATLSPDGARIAFQKKTPHGWRICVSRLDGTGRKIITQGPGNDVEPCWRADGAVLAFASDRPGNWDLFQIRPDGTGLRALTHTPQDERSPQWSPRSFELAYDKDPLRRTVADRARSAVAPSDLKLLEMLAKEDSSWAEYRDRFESRQAARYYKLLFVEGQGDARRLATMREDGRMRQTLSTGIAGPHLNPCWERTASRIAFLVHRGSADVAYAADYPVTHDLNEGEGTPRFGIDLKEFRKSLKRVGSFPGQGAQVAWSPSGEYLAVAAGGSLRLLPQPGLGRTTITAQTKAVAPFGFTWLPDARTALLTVTGPAFTTVALTDPLLDVVNTADFDDLQTQDRALLARNAFVAAGAPEKQMYSVYEETDYQNLPVFVTTDSLFHLHHLVFDYLLRGVESEHLTPTVITLVNHYLQASLSQAQAADDPTLKGSASANAAFFAVAARLALGDVHTGEMKAAPPDPDDPLAADRAAWRGRQDKKDRAQLALWTDPLRRTLAGLPPDVSQLAAQEIALIDKHAARAGSPVFGGSLSPVTADAPIADTRIDYTDFIPRGHYTRSEILRRYFLVSRWLSAGPFRRTPDLTQRALLIVAATDPPTRALWEKVQTVVRQFVGAADDQDLTSYGSVAKDVYGGSPTPAVLADAGKLADFLTRVENLPPPRIAPSAGPSFRFLPAPYTPDAEIMQGLVYDGNAPDVGTQDQPRYFALGLDVMGVLGSERAHSLLQSLKFQGTFFNFDLAETQYAHYDTQFAALQSQFGAWTDEDWSRSLYTRTLYALSPLLTQPGGGPTGQHRNLFLQSPAWVDKDLNTALGTWAELKHDTLPKQPTAIELGGEGGISETVVAEQPVGYVEPAPEAYRRLGLLVAAERKTLADDGYLTPAVGQRLDTLSALLDMVQHLAGKQEAGTTLSAREVEQLRFFGGYLEHLTLVTSEGGGQGSMEGNDMAIVADVSSAFSTRLGQQLALEEGVGRALPLYVAVPFRGHRVLARGAVFTYYEFTHPAEDRLTDERWRDLLDSKDAPDVPAWTRTFITRLENPGSE